MLLISLLLVTASFSSGHALNCTTCQSESSWEDCRKVANVVTCTVDDVNSFHAVEAVANPTLTQGGSDDGFQCYALYLRSKDSSTASPDRFSTGCTFKNTDFCAGWVNLLEVVQCGTSEVGDVSFSGVGGLAGSLVVMFSMVLVLLML